jgi:hypothetical protein
MDTTETINAVRERGGEFTAAGMTLTVLPKGILTDEERDFIKSHKLEVLATVSGKPLSDFTEGESFEATPTKKAVPRITPEQNCDRVRRDQAARGAYFQIPEPCLTGRNFPSGHQSLLEWLEALETEGHVVLNLEKRFAFTISASVFAPDGITLIKDAEWTRWSFDDAGVEMLQAKARKQVSR